MRLLSVRIDGVTRMQLRHWQRLIHGSIVSRWIWIGASILFASSYAFSHPGHIVIAIPASGIPALGNGVSGRVAVTGKVANIRVRAVSLVVNGVPQKVDTGDDGRFERTVDLGPDVTFIQAVGPGAYNTFTLKSNVIMTGIEVCGDGLDNDFDTGIDEGCDYQLYVGDNQCKDDTIAVYLDGHYLGDTPPAADKYFNLGGFDAGKHKLKIRAKASEPARYGDTTCEPNNTVVSFEVRFGDTFAKEGEIEVNQERNFTIEIQ